MSVERLKVPVEQLARVCDPADLGFETTSELAPLEGTIGQERAISALELSLDIEAPGFNLFISGIPGTGRNTALRAYIERIAQEKPIPGDWGYVYNFEDPFQPRAISLPCGWMRGLAHDMNELVSFARREIPSVFESDDYQRRVEEVTREIESRRQQMTDQLEQQAQRQGFTLTFTQMGVTPVPTTQGRPMTQEEYQALGDEQREQMRQRAEALQREIARAFNEMRRLNKEAIERVKALDTEIIRYALKPYVDELQEKYAEHPQVVEHFDDVENDMVEHLSVFKPQEQQPQPLPFLPQPGRDDDFFARYQVNDLVDNTSCEGAPIIYEYSPTYYNLFGRIEYRARMGTMTTDHTMIKAGAIHRANGGYLVLQARDLLSSPFSYDALKRTLRSGLAHIENVGEQYSPLPSATLRPQPIPVRAKVVLVGNPEIVRLLQFYDEDFQRYFKVVADFDTVMDRTKENMAKYAAFVASRSKEQGLRPFHRTAVARIIDYSSRRVEDQEKLSTRFMDIADMITEADYWAGRDGSGVV
ncbi:MAG: AAA family ATPase, partial [Chloroflexi bacterium]|nr:AAA family ATPase [Chloroflexota bacterium]